MAQNSLFAPVAPPMPLHGNGEVHIGTSGYIFADWRGEFYPEKLPQNKWLEYYSNFFSAVEINATYYKLLPTSSFESMSNVTPDNFKFWVKVPGNITHNIQDIESTIDQFTESICPLIESGKLSGVLAQFPPSFTHSTSNLDYLQHIREKFFYTEVAIEFRSSEWSDPSVYELFEANGIVPVVVDLPELSGLPETILTTSKSIGYVRLHGRNGATWYNQKLGDRYDYNYSVSELEIWKNHAASMSEMAGVSYLFFNNCMQVKL